MKHYAAYLLLTTILMGCQSESPSDPSLPSTARDTAPAVSSPVVLGRSEPITWDRRCDEAPFPSPEWTGCELENVLKTLQAPVEQLAQGALLQAVIQQSGTNVVDYLQRVIQDPSWLLLSLQGPSLNLNTPITSLTATYAGPAVSDPFRYPTAAGPNGVLFYTQEAVVTPVVFFDADCTRLSGRVWRPRNSAGRLPGIVINNGSVQAHEPAYWWAAQALVRAGYQVLTYDPRGQGRSDFTAPDGSTGTNLDPTVFWTGLVDAIDFQRSTPDRPAPHQARCARSYPNTTTTLFNPEHAALDLARLGLLGHSLGAIGVSVVQGYGAPGADPWPGLMDTQNPVDVIVAWDGLLSPAGGLIGGALQGGGLGDVLSRLGLADPIFRFAIERGLPRFGIQVPAMSHGSDYGVAIAPFVLPPDPEQRKALGFNAWQAAGQPVMDLIFQGSTHLEWSQLIGLPATSWCASTAGQRCTARGVLPSIEHYTMAWLDRWLKQPGEPGFDTADARLLDDNNPLAVSHLSFRYRSARALPDRQGTAQVCLDLRAGCGRLMF